MSKGKSKKKSAKTALEVETPKLNGAGAVETESEGVAADWTPIPDLREPADVIAPGEAEPPADADPPVLAEQPAPDAAAAAPLDAATGAPFG